MQNTWLRNGQRTWVTGANQPKQATALPGHASFIEDTYIGHASGTKGCTAASHLQVALLSTKWPSPRIIVTEQNVFDEISSEGLNSDRQEVTSRDRDDFNGDITGQSRRPKRNVCIYDRLPLTYISRLTQVLVFERIRLRSSVRERRE